MDLYCGLSKLRDADGRQLFTHTTVNHSKNFVNPTDGMCTNAIESRWNVAKSRNRARWGTHRSMLDSYLCDFMWCERNQEQNLFTSIMRDIARFYPLE